MAKLFYQPLGINKSKYHDVGTDFMTNAMKGRKYKECIFCGKKYGFGPYPFIRPYAVCSSCIDNVTSYSSLMDRWQDRKMPLDQKIKEAKKAYRESQED